VALRLRLLPGVPFDWKWRLGTPTLRSGTGVVNKSYQRLVSSAHWTRAGGFVSVPGSSRRPNRRCVEAPAEVAVGTAAVELRP
jgi:hypothetical protein